MVFRLLTRKRGEKQAPTPKQLDSPKGTEVQDDTAHGQRGVDKPSVEKVLATSIVNPYPSHPLVAPSRNFHEEIPTEIDAKDLKTKDEWIPRHPDIIRLTGKHPLNCEPPLTTLMECGFITPPALHYVRNHGAVPRIKWEDHRITINGLVDKPLTLTMDELVKMPNRTIPVTLVCAGNRRKEENMIKKTIGFSWGAAGVSTSYWTGVRLCDLLKEACIKTPAEGARYVCFRGPLQELPQGSDGSYGTSVTYDVAMNPAEDVMICWKQNDEFLTPDHGYPVRLIIPGFIGGRMIKFLEEITVTPVESDNFYHYYDNRVLPSHVDQEIAKKEGWWQKPDFIINQLNINSAIAFPQNDEVVPLDGSIRQYPLRGYAYNGGGRKIIRVEITWDGGESWHLADIHRFEEPTEYGRYWCWVFWTFQMPIGNFVKTKEFAVRAWDEAMNTQPKDITWNVTGMMNNSHFRVKLNTFIDEETGKAAVRCQHPTIAGPAAGGWMPPPDESLAAAAAAPAPPPAVPAASAAEARSDKSNPPSTTAPAVVSVTATTALPPGLKRYTMAEVEKHNTEQDVWLVYHGKVYDATSYLKEHPGGVDSIMINAGMDCTEEFDAIHSKTAKALVEKYLIGVLDESAGAAEPEAPATPPPGVIPGLGKGLSFLDPKKKLKLPLIHKEELSHNVRLFRFGLSAPLMKLGMPTGKHLFMYGKHNGETVMRAYTPATADEVRGYVDLIVKIYFKNQHPSFPEGGKMSQYLDSLAIGDEVEVRGPMGHFVYNGNGRFVHSGHEGSCTKINMIAGGTGITPMWVVLKAVLADSADSTQVRLLFANTAPRDIMLRRELDDFAAKYPNKFAVSYTISANIPEGWTGFTGHINEEMMGKALFPAGDDVMTQVCGPPAMVEKCVLPKLEALGYPKEHIVVN